VQFQPTVSLSGSQYSAMPYYVDYAGVESEKYYSPDSIALFTEQYNSYLVAQARATVR